MNLIELLNLERPLLLFDTETTGPNPKEDHIVEMAFLRIYPTDGSWATKEWSSLFNPGVPIPKEATYGRGDAYPGHGITDAMVNGCRVCFEQGHLDVEQEIHDSIDRGHTFAPWPRFSDLVENLLKGFTNTDFGGYNIKGFDLPLMQTEFGRCGERWSYAEARIADSFAMWRVGQGRTLSDASEYFLGRSHKGAHRALDDVKTTLDVMVAQLIKFTQLPRTVAQLHDACWPRDPNAIDSEGKLIWKDGEAVFTFGKNWKGKKLSAMSRRDLDWIANVATGMSDEVKQICREAKDGRFPQPKLKEVNE